MAVTNSITGTSHVGGLVGASGLLSGILDADPSSVTDSYWDNKVSLSIPQLDTNTFGSSQSTTSLTNPMDFTGTGNIYAEWDNAYCNPNTGEYSATAPNPIGDYVRVWDLGTSSQYPAITCVRNFFSLADQRAATARVVAGESPLID